MFKGSENCIFPIELVGERFILKVFRDNRMDFDSDVLKEKYMFYKDHDILDILDIGGINTDKRNLYIIYRYIMGDSKFLYSNQDLEILARKLFEFHNYDYKNDCFNYDNSYVKRIMDENNLLNKMPSFDSCFIHGDLHPGNIIWTSNETLAFIDLDNCAYGPREYDISNIRFDIALYNGVRKAEDFWEYYNRLYKTSTESIYNWDKILLNIQEKRVNQWINNSGIDCVVPLETIHSNYFAWEKYIISI